MITDILVMVASIGTGIAGVYFIFKLRNHSNKIVMENTKQGQEVVRIFNELFAKAAETNPELLKQTITFNSNEALSQAGEVINSNHVVVSLIKSDRLYQSKLDNRRILKNSI